MVGGFPETWETRDSIGRQEKGDRTPVKPFSLETIYGHPTTF